MDPITIALLSGAVGGGGGKLVETLWQATGQRWLTDYLKDHSEAARDSGNANTLEFLSQLSIRIGRLEDEITDPSEIGKQVLRDPDFLASLKAALLAAARSPDQLKHDVLARAVAERMLATADSLQALAANIAVEQTPRLSSHHLQILALASVVYVLRPEGLPLPDKHPDGSEAWDVAEDEREILSRYPDWLKTAISFGMPDAIVSAADYAHLASCGCLVLERGIERDLFAILRPYRDRLLSQATVGPCNSRISDWLYGSDAGFALRQLWDHGMQQVSITPAGLLIGVAVYDFRSGESTSVDWKSNQLTKAPEVEDLSVWNGHTIREEFLKVLDKEIKNRAERGVSPWRPLDR